MSRLQEEAESLAALFGWSMQSVRSASKARGLVRCRQAMAYLLRRNPDFKPSFPEIGAALNRDHSTIILGAQSFARALNAQQEWAVELMKAYDLQAFEGKQRQGNGRVLELYREAIERSFQSAVGAAV